MRALSRYCRVCLDLAAIAIGLLLRDMTTGVSGSDSREGSVDKVVRKIMELGRGDVRLATDLAQDYNNHGKSAKAVASGIAL